MVRGECLRRHVLNGRLAEPDGDGHDVRVEWAQVTTIIVALATFTGMQAVVLARALDRVYSAHDRVEARLDRIEGVVLRDHGERSLEAAHGD